MMNDYNFNWNLDKRKISVDQSVRTKFHAESWVLSDNPWSYHPMWINTSKKAKNLSDLRVSKICQDIILVDIINESIFESISSKG